MFELIIGTNTNRDRIPCELTSTIRQALENADIDYTVGTLHLDGISLKTGDMDKTFAELGITTKASLINVVKGDAA